MSTYEFELNELGATNSGFDSEATSIWSGTESPRCPLLYLHKRTRKEKVILRKGPAPLEDLALTGPGHVSLHPGILDDNILDELSTTKVTNEGDSIKDLEVSRAGSRGLLTYFAKLANSPEEEQIDVEFVNSLLRGGADINVTDLHGQCIMHEVVRQWHVNVAQFCMEKGADIDKPDSFGRTPLHLASAINYPEMIEWLVRNGADVHKKTKGESQTPIHYAAKGNAIDALQTLLHLDANILDRDYKERTPLSVAAEAGRSDACRFLLENGAPAGVYDDCGSSALSLMVEKMPDVAKEALAQFQEVDTALRRKYFYLNYLEVQNWRALAHKTGKPLRQSHARSSLQVIVLYNELNLIIHPVILRLVKLKWDLFGKWSAIFYLLVNFFYTFIWSAICVLLPRSHATPHYTPLKDNAFKIVIEIIGCVMTFVLIVQQTFAYRRTQSKAKIYEQWKVREIERDLQYCHPRWPEEERFITSELNLVRSSTFSYLADPWNIFEWITCLGILLIMGTRAATILLGSEIADAIHHRSAAFVLILIWLRLMKYFRAFQSLGPFIIMLGHVITATFKFAFLFFEIFIPYCCAFWILFGERPGTEFMYVNDLIYQVFLMTLVADYNFDQLTSKDKVIAQILVGSYLAISSVICLNLYIALMSDTFARVWEKATANAYMSQASQLFLAEEALSDAKNAEMTNILLEDCSPQVVFDSNQDNNGFTEKEMIDSLALKLEQMSKTINKLTDNSLAIIGELQVLRNESSELQWHQKSTTNEILRLTKDSSKWEIRNLLKRFPASVSERVKRSFAKEPDDNEDEIFFPEEEERKSTNLLGWKWLKK